MSAFFVGQRVRMIASDNPDASAAVGSETRIVAEFFEFGYGDCWEMDNKWCVPKAMVGNYFEPILPSGHRPAELTVEELLPFLNERAQA